MVVERDPDAWELRSHEAARRSSLNPKPSNVAIYVTASYD